MRFLLLPVVVVFTFGIGALTAQDIVDHGLTWLDVLALLVVLLFGTGIVGALLHRPKR